MTTGVGYSLSLDLTGSTTYVLVDVVSVSENFGEIIDTYFKLSDEGFPTNEVTALDPQFDFVFKFEDGDAQLDGILEKRWKVGTDRQVGYQIIDNATGNTITGDAVLTAIGSTREVQIVVEVPCSMKLRGKPTIAVTP